jgi:S-methylmethionine-dependent homocysteine/selenocysteine methylase
MSTYRTDLPQTAGRAVFLTDGGIETTLMFDDGFDLVDFACFPLLASASGRAALLRYFDAYCAIAVRDGRGIVLDTPTWRANADWGRRLGYDAAELAAVNRDAVSLLTELRQRNETPTTPVVISGCIGPRGDGYVPGAAMSADEARDYHSAQLDTFAATEADLVSALTLNYVAEGLGIAQAAHAAGIPIVLSFTVETDGRLATGMSVEDAVEAIDEQTDGYPAYYMINCAHPNHFLDVLDPGRPALWRIAGVRANASRRSHAELDESDSLDRGDPDELAARYQELAAILPALRVVGGCCGTDDRHVDAISRALA